MKAIKLDNKTLAVTEIRGVFVYYTNDKNQVKCIETAKAEVIEVEESEIYAPKFTNSKTKKLNPANFINKEEFSKSKYANMSNDDFIQMRKNDAMNCKSW